jgi:predicted RNA-binding protein with RPS1 domain
VVKTDKLRNFGHYMSFFRRSIAKKWVKAICEDVLSIGLCVHILIMSVDTIGKT